MPGAGITIDYRELVLEMMERVLFGKPRTSSIMLEFRLTLFVAAAASKDYDRCLLPFPTCYFDRVTKEKDICQLQDHILKIPPLENLDPKTVLPPLVWELLYWVFTNPLTISPMFESNMVYATPTELGLTFKAIEARTKLAFPEEVHCLPNRNYFVFEVKIPHPNPAFLDGTEKYGSYFAFHGSPLCNFHSIVHRGLRAALNRRSAYGHGTYLSSDWAMSNGYAHPGLAWEKSIFGRTLRCIAICEVVNAPTGLTKHQIPHSANTIISVVAEDHLIQLAYLIMYAPEYNISSNNNKTPMEMEISTARIKANWDMLQI